MLHQLVIDDFAFVVHIVTCQEGPQKRIGLMSKNSSLSMQCSGSVSLDNGSGFGPYSFFLSGFKMLTKTKFFRSSSCLYIYTSLLK
jgi:hypothetical protein